MTDVVKVRLPDEVIKRMTDSSTALLRELAKAQEAVNRAANEANTAMNGLLVAVKRFEQQTKRELSGTISALSEKTAKKETTER